MKSDKDIIKILHLPKLEELNNPTKDSKEVHKLLTQNMLLAFKTGYSYGCLGSANNKLNECLDIISSKDKSGCQNCGKYFNYDACEKGEIYKDTECKITVFICPFCRHGNY